MLRPGDKVRWLDHAGEGKVVRVLGKSVWVLSDGLEVESHACELVKVEYDEILKSNESPLPVKDAAAAKKAREALGNGDAIRHTAYEIDLHIHELVDRYAHLSNSQILEIQMRACRSFVEEARRKRYGKVILIHGVGEGVLKSEIHRWLDGLTYATYHDAPYRTYGYGATEVIVRQ